MKTISFLILILILLMNACTENTIEIKTSDSEKANIKEAYIRTTKIEVPENSKEKERAFANQTKTNPTLKILSPKNGEPIKGSKVTVELKTENFNISPIGEPVKEGEGHYHVWLDSEKKLIANNLVTFEKVVSGRHTIVAELVKSNHSSLSPRVTQTITITVESGYIPIEESIKNISEFTVEADDNGFYPNKIQSNIGDKVKINFKFRDNSIYFAGLDVKGPFPDIKYKLGGQQPVLAEFTMKEETKITSWWPASGIKKAELIVEAKK